MQTAFLRIACVLAAITNVALAAGIAARQSWATPLWPWPDGRLTYWFVASILASIAAALLWIGITGRWRAALPGTVNVAVSAGAMAIYLAAVYVPSPPGNAVPVVHATALAAFAVVSVGLFFLAKAAPALDSRRMPAVVFVSFVVFAVVLVLVGGALVIGVPNMMPWPMQQRSAVLVGWIFLGDALYFLLPLFAPAWNNARAPLLSFLAYDAVLLPPLAGHLSTVKPEHQLSLFIYLAVLVYSGSLAVYYLFLAPATRAGLLRKSADEA